MCGKCARTMFLDPKSGKEVNNMQYNYKKELIYHSETPSSNAPFIVHLSGLTMPNPNYFITQNTSTNDFFNRYQF